jgi:hypothetical protein
MTKKTIKEDLYNDRYTGTGGWQGQGTVIPCGNTSRTKECSWEVK